jgi:ribose/xylose/arabinose/galactoside ABC-type transport system permease subunit
MSPPWRRTLLHSAVALLMAILTGVVHVFIENDLRLPDFILTLLPKIGLLRCRSLLARP